MAITGKKITDLNLTTILSDDSVFPIVIVDDGVAETVAKKVTISQLSSYIGGGGGGSIPVAYYYEYPTWNLSADKKILTSINLSNANAVWVFKNGLKLRPDTTSTSYDNDYYVSGTNIRFNVALDDTDVINLEVF